MMMMMMMMIITITIIIIKTSMSAILTSDYNFFNFFTPPSGIFNRGLK